MNRRIVQISPYSRKSLIALKYVTLLVSACPGYGYIDPEMRLQYDLYCVVDGICIDSNADRWLMAELFTRSGKFITLIRFNESN
jgi:hypothetical protein